MPESLPIAQDPAAKLQANVAAFLAAARAKAAGGFTVAEFGSLVVELLRLTVTGLDAIPTDGAANRVRREPDKAAIRAQIEAGEDVPGAELVRGPNTTALRVA